MIGWWWCAVAGAAPWDPWLGLWGLDPSVSDDPLQQLQSSVTAPAVGGGAAEKMAPDGGKTDPDDQRKHALDDALALLGCSGGIELRARGELLGVVWTGEQELSVSLDRRWVKIDREPQRWKVRAWMDGENLVLERRQRATSVAETFLPGRPGEVVVVVWVEAPSLNPPVEFRRVYRPLVTPAVSGDAPQSSG